MAKAVLSFPVGIGLLCPGKIAGAWGPEAVLRSCGCGSSERVQQPEELIGPE